jgi:hypothetical protein
MAVISFACACDGQPILPIGNFNARSASSNASIKPSRLQA